jgi:hypothetical protein
VVDALYRGSHEFYISSNNMYRIDLKDKILEAVNSNQQYIKMKDTL